MFYAVPNFAQATIPSQRIHRKVHSRNICIHVHLASNTNTPPRGAVADYSLFSFFFFFTPDASVGMVPLSAEAAAQVLCSASNC